MASVILTELTKVFSGLAIDLAAAYFFDSDSGETIAAEAVLV